MRWMRRLAKIFYVLRMGVPAIAGPVGFSSYISLKDIHRGKLERGWAFLISFVPKL